jgi:hypothetical protein
MCDFETALLKALAIKFPDAKIKGYWFHFNKALIIKIIQSWYVIKKTRLKIFLLCKGFKNLFLKNYEFKLWVRSFDALAQIPLDYLKEEGNIIIDKIPIKIDDKLKTYIQYFINVWLTSRREKHFNPTIWNHYGCIGYRTNNHLEGFFSQLKKDLADTKNRQKLFQVS